LTPRAATCQPSPTTCTRWTICVSVAAKSSLQASCTAAAERVCASWTPLTATCQPSPTTCMRWRICVSVAANGSPRTSCTAAVPHSYRSQCLGLVGHVVTMYRHHRPLCSCDIRQSHALELRQRHYVPLILYNARNSSFHIVYASDVCLDNGFYHFIVTFILLLCK
jgi:hypothetical protein